MDPLWERIVAMGCITAITVTALWKDINGVVLSGAFGAICAIVGVKLGMVYQKKKA